MFYNSVGLIINILFARPNVCIVTELVEKGTLRTLLHSNAELSTKTRIEFALQIAKGLHYLHSSDPKRAFIHRDINSNSILVWRVGGEK